MKLNQKQIRNLTLGEFYGLLYEYIDGHTTVPYICSGLVHLCWELKISNYRYEYFSNHFNSQLPTETLHPEFYNNEYFVGEGTGKLGYVGFGWWSDYLDHEKFVNEQRLLFVQHLWDLQYEWFTCNQQTPGSLDGEVMVKLKNGERYIGSYNTYSMRFYLKTPNGITQFNEFDVNVWRYLENGK